MATTIGPMSSPAIGEPIDSFTARESLKRMVRHAKDDDSDARDAADLPGPAVVAALSETSDKSEMSEAL